MTPKITHISRKLPAIPLILNTPAYFPQDKPSTASTADTGIQIFASQEQEQAQTCENNQEPSHAGITALALPVSYYVKRHLPNVLFLLCTLLLALLIIRDAAAEEFNLNLFTNSSRTNNDFYNALSMAHDSIGSMGRFRHDNQPNTSSYSYENDYQTTKQSFTNGSSDSNSYGDNYSNSNSDRSYFYPRQSSQGSYDGNRDAYRTPNSGTASLGTRAGREAYDDKYGEGYDDDYRLAGGGRASSRGLTGDLSVSSIVKRIVTEMMYAQDIFVEQGMRILFWLGGLAFVFESGFLILNGRYDLTSFAAVMVRIIFILGFLNICVMNGYMITSDIINSFAGLAFEASYDVEVGATVSMLDKFFELCGSICQAIDTQNIFFSVMFMMVIYVCLALLVVTYIVTYISAFFVALICSIAFCFGALKYTSFIAKNYIMLLLDWGFRLFSFYFIIIIGQNILGEVVDTINDSIAAGNVIHIQDAGYILIIFISIVCLSTICPRAIGGMFNRISQGK